MKSFEKIANGAAKPKAIKSFVPLETEARSHVSTECAAFHLSRKQETLRLWACRPSSAPINPIRINRRLAWPVAEIRRLLAGGGEQ